MAGWRATAAAIRRTIPARRGGALRAAAALALPLLVGLATGHPADGGLASFGALAVIYVPDAPYRYRARVVSAVGLALVAVAVLGGLVAGSSWLAVLTAGTVAGVASFICQAAELPPPRELMIVMVLLVSTELPVDLAEAGRRAALVAAGAAMAWLLSMSPMLVGRRTPETAALRSALTAVGEYLDCVGTPGATATRHAAVLAVRRATAAGQHSGLPPGHSVTRLVVATESLLEAALHAGVEADGPLDQRWSEAVAALVRALSDNREVSIVPPSSGPGAGELTRALTALAAIRTDAPTAVEGPGVDPYTRRGWFRAATGRRSIILLSAVRIGLAVALGVGVGRALGVSHAYWVGLTAAAILQANNLSVTRRRFIYRVVGTLIGVGLVYAVLVWHPPTLAVILLVAVFQGVVELVIATHYGIAVVGITVLSLLLFHLSAPDAEVQSLILARILDTALGAVIALALRAGLWPQATSARLARVQTRVLMAVRAVLSAEWSDAGDRATVAQTRRQLRADVVALRAVQADAFADASRRAGHDIRWLISATVQELAVLALALPTREPPDRAERQAFLTTLDQITAAIGDETAPLVEPAALPDFPRTSAALAELTMAIRDAR